MTAEEDGSEPVVIAVSRKTFNSRFFQPDHNSGEEPLTYVLQEKESALYKQWKKAKGTWRDSLLIYESVIYAAAIHIGVDNLPYPNC